MTPTVGGPPVLCARSLCRAFGTVEVVRDATLEIRSGEWVSLEGPSGSGKTTLLQMLGLLDRPGSGRVELCGVDAWALGSGARAQARLEQIGFVFQSGNLLGHLSTRENIALPYWRLHGSRRRALDRATELMERFGVVHRADVRASRLSTGEAQRVAIARALVNAPRVLLVDEPTGNLDSANGRRVLDALATVREDGAGLLVVTHDASVAERGRRLSMYDGRVT